MVSLNVPVTYPPLDVRGVVVSGMDAPHLDAALSGAPQFAERLRAEVPRYSLRYFWKRAPQSLDELAENARLTAESFLGRAEGGLLADRMVPDWSALMVQFQNLDPFQHRAWRYLNVDETGIDDPAWNDAAAGVIRGLDVAIGLLAELAERRGAAVLVVSDHGFGSCLGRVHVNRILIEAGVARVPGLAGRLGRRARQATDHLRLWGAKRDDPTARSSSFDLSITAQFPFDWKRTLAFAPHQDTAAMVYLNSTERRAGAPLATPRQVDEALAAASDALAGARHPETGIPLFPQVIATADAYGIDPAREGYPDLIALPDEQYWVRTKLAPGRDLGRGRPEPAGHASSRGDRRPRRGRARPGPDPRGQPARHRPDDPVPLRPPDPRARRGPAPRRPGHPLRHPDRPPLRRRRRPAPAAVRVHPRRAGPHRAEAGRPGLPGISRSVSATRPSSGTDLDQIRRRLTIRSDRAGDEGCGRGCTPGRRR